MNIQHRIGSNVNLQKITINVFNTQIILLQFKIKYLF